MRMQTQQIDRRVVQQSVDEGMQDAEGTEPEVGRRRGWTLCHVSADSDRDHRRSDFAGDEDTSRWDMLNFFRRLC